MDHSWRQGSKSDQTLTELIESSFPCHLLVYGPSSNSPKNEKDRVLKDSSKPLFITPAFPQFTSFSILDPSTSSALPSPTSLENLSKHPPSKWTLIGQPLESTYLEVEVGEIEADQQQNNKRLTFLTVYDRSQAVEALLKKLEEEESMLKRMLHKLWKESEKVICSLETSFSPKDYPKVWSLLEFVRYKWAVFWVKKSKYCDEQEEHKGAPFLLIL
jgi:hypothetical protein